MMSIKATTMHRKHLAAAVLAVLGIVGSIPTASADYFDDTEVFRDQANIAGGNPNVLILVDTGSEMGSFVSGTSNPATGGQKTRKKKAIVAVARKLLVRCWVMLLRKEPWHPETMIKQPPDIAVAV